MSTSNPWHFVINRCEELFKADETFRWLPDSDGEPWVPYVLVAELVRQEKATVEENVSNFGIPRHPMFTGLVKISSFKFPKVKEIEKASSGKRRKGSSGVSRKVQ